MGMFQFGNGSCLALEAFDKLLVTSQVMGQHFDGHVPIHPRLVRLVNGRHPAHANLL